MTGTITPYESLRQADIPDLAAVLNAQRARATDVVADASLIKVALTDTGPAISLSGITEPVLSDDGVTDINGLYVPTTVADEGIAAKLDIPLPYLRKCRVQDPYLYRKNIEGWLKRDERRFLLRLFRGDDSRVGVLRAFLSDQYRVIDNLDVLLAVLKGITDAGVENPIVEADLTDRRMIVRVIVPQIALYAEKFLKDYRNPFTGEQSLRGWTPERLRQAALNEGHSVDDKVIFAGFVFTNSEVGGGAFRITPRIVIGPCTNGLQLAAEAVSRTHLGAKLEEGVVQWSQETLESNLRLITSQATDAVRTYLDVDFITRQVEKLSEEAQTPIRNPQAVVTNVSKKLGFTEGQARDILAQFIRGGQVTAGGVMQAVSAQAQLVGDGDTAHDMESAAVKAMGLAREADKLVGVS